METTYSRVLTKRIKLEGSPSSQIGQFRKLEKDFWQKFYLIQEEYVPSDLKYIIDYSTVYNFKYGNFDILVVKEEGEEAVNDKMYIIEKQNHFLFDPVKSQMWQVFENEEILTGKKSKWILEDHLGRIYPLKKFVYSEYKKINPNLTLVISVKKTIYENMINSKHSELRSKIMDFIYASRTLTLLRLGNLFCPNSVLSKLPPSIFENILNIFKSDF